MGLDLSTPAMPDSGLADFFDFGGLHWSYSHVNAVWADFHWHASRRERSALRDFWPISLGDMGELTPGEVARIAPILTNITVRAETANDPASNDMAYVAGLFTIAQAASEVVRWC